MNVATRQSLLQRAVSLLLVCAVLQLGTIIGAVATTPALQARVVGGTNAPTNAAPFIVSIQYSGQHYCAGSIINQNWVLTAAHCLTRQSQVMNSVLVAGTNNVANTAATTQKRNVNKYVSHDLYTGGTAPYDIGLIYTSTPFQWSAAVSAVALPAKGATASGNVALYGWGSTSTTGTPSYPSMLQVAQNLPIISLSSCESALGNKGKDVHNTNLCTGPLSGGVGICSSDSGGPLVQQQSGKTVLVGIVSWGQIPCGQPNSPSVYVQVSSFIPWITNNQAV